MTRWGAYRGRGPKFGNTPKRCRENVMHQSGLEAARCDELHLMLQARPPLISDLQAHPQPTLKLEVNGYDVTTYRPDFLYRDLETGAWVYEDTKGIRTKEYELKRRLVKAVHGIDITEVWQVRGRK